MIRAPRPVCRLHSVVRRMKAIALLRQDHKKIDRMLDHLERALNPFDAHAVARAIHFFELWVDQLHHTKEEDVLFEELMTRAPDLARGPIQVMRTEHAVTRTHLEKAKQLMSDQHVRSRELIKRHLDTFAQIMRNHIVKEDRALFVLCEQLIPPSMDERLLERFHAATDGLIGEDALAALDRLADRPEDTQVIRRQPTTEITSRTQEPLDAKTLARGAEPGDVTHLSAKRNAVLFRRDDHRNLLLHDFGHGMAVQANQFLIVHGDEGMLLDPGGPKVYPNVFAETMIELHEGWLRYIFLSHQDPDICTSLNAWLMDTQADALVSRLWSRFLPHFGIDSLLEERMKPIPDGGTRIELGGAELVILPAHFLHSCGNFHVYDPISKVLFSGDLGASIGSEETYVRDFDAHAERMLSFHRRYMASNRALRAWADMVSDLEIDAIAPQHGPIMKGPDMVARFLEWVRRIECGIDVMTPVFRVPPTG
jgi:hemerythrin-like domain-containing protein/glyoxylase-like metal-dependent hydrolase (beta-lactamase superfamily II)